MVVLFQILPHAPQQKTPAQDEGSCLVTVTAFWMLSLTIKRTQGLQKPKVQFVLQHQPMQSQLQ
jgi:hypothetical protein